MGGEPYYFDSTVTSEIVLQKHLSCVPCHHKLKIKDKNLLYIVIQYKYFKCVSDRKFNGKCS